MAYSGKFVRNRTTNTVKSSSRNWGTGVDPGHMQSAMGDDQGFPALTGVKSAHVPANVVDAYDPAGVNADPNLRAPEMEPNGHDGYGAPARTSNVYDGIRSDTRRHETNFGATLKNTATMVMRSVTQTFGSPRIPSLGLQTDDASGSNSGEARRALRGFNSLAENNPGSPDVNFSGDYNRAGLELFRWTERSMPNRTLTHTLRPSYVNTAKVANVSMPGNGSPYGSPFPSVASLNVGTARPMQRRDPRVYMEDAVTDGVEYYADTSQMNAWGL